MAEAPAVSVEHFMTYLSRCRLIPVAELRRIVAKIPPELGTTRAIARWLVDNKHLTAFQASQLQAGKWRSLVMKQYHIQSFLGRGGMGQVLRAVDTKTRKEVALKILAPQKSTNDRHRRRFEREGEVLQKLTHPGVARAIETGQVGDLAFLAMEYVPGPTLYRLVRKVGPIPIYWAVRWMTELADVLDQIHQQGVVHRDLKPSNIIIRPDHRAVLLDLGLARWFNDDHNEDEVVGQKRIVGSFDYIAPEQAKNSARADARCDIYSMGCLMYFMLAGEPPFAQVVGRAKLIAHQKQLPTSLAIRRPDLPAKLLSIIERMMIKQPKDRFQVAAQVRDALTEFQRSQPVLPDAPKFNFEQLFATATTEDEGGSESGSDPVMVEDDAAPTVPAPAQGLWSRVGGKINRMLRKPKDE